MPEQEIGIEEARGILGDLVERVRYSGTAVTLTRYGKPVARIVPVLDDEKKPKTGDAADG
ncbi:MULTISPECIES: type II toxin-antitoxin system Phd/YefM family antitoxin [unclassified Streptomyces]|uniref:type II toxin-antitoxin system Phd/YefM family antitoxin n=1 Tax=unclassified Streptomyces TaxID=2593676 RepID=UPI0034111382